MNVRDKRQLYSEAHRVLKSEARLVIYDILQGEGGDVLYPMPWAMEPSISRLATPTEMAELLHSAGFRILSELDSTEASYNWLIDRAKGPRSPTALPATTPLLFGGSARDMTENQLLSLGERRMLTYAFVYEDLFSTGLIFKQPLANSERSRRRARLK